MLQPFELTLKAKNRLREFRVTSSLIITTLCYALGHYVQEGFETVNTHQCFIFIIKQNLLIQRKGYFCRETVDTLQSETFSSWQVKKIKCIDARALSSICLMRLLKSKLQNEWQDKE